MAINPKDAELVSNAVLDGDLELSNLTPQVQQMLASYWQSGSGKDPLAAPDSGAIQALVEQRTQQRGEGVGGLPTIFKPIEAIGSGLYWLYSQTVSPMLSTVALGLHRGFYGKEQEDQFKNDFWGVKDAKDLWKDAHSVSPGQAIWMLGFDNDELKKRGISPNQMASDKDQLKAGTYRDTPSKTDPYGTLPAYQEYFGSGASKWATGTTDFALSWYMDPLVVTGQWAGKGIQKGFKKPVTEELAKAAEKGTPATAFERLSQGSTFQSMVNLVEQTKLANPDNAALVLRRDLPTLANSANGDVLARLLAQTKNADETVDVLRVAMGDAGGFLALQARDSVLFSQVQQLGAAQVVHGTYFNSLSPAKQASPYGQRVKAAIDQQEQAIARMDAERGIISDKMAAFGAIENMNYNRLTTPLGMKIKGSDAVRMGGEMRSVRGEGMIKGTANLVYNSTIGFPIKVVRSYGDLKPSHYIDVHGENSYKELDAALSEYKGLDRATRERLVSDYIKATPNERARALIRIENTAVRDMIDKYNLKNPGNEIDRAIADDLYKDFIERRQGQQAAAGKRQSYGSAEIMDPNNVNRTIRVAEVEADGGRLVSTPIFDTQLANNHIMMDFRTMERAINVHGKNWQKTRKYLGEGWYKTTAVADQLGSIWKFAQLARLGYAPRALADDFLGQVARFGGMAMLARAGQGGKIFVQDFTRGRFMKSDIAQVRRQAGVLEQDLAEKSAQQASIRAQLDRVRAGKAQGDVVALEDDLTDISNTIDQIRMDHKQLTESAAFGSQMRDVQIGREIFSGALAGKQGELYRDLSAGQRNFANMMGSSSDWYLKKMRRLNWENITPASAGNEKHLDAWFRHVNDQIAQSSIGKQVLKGSDEYDLTRWMRNTPEGQAYRRDIGIKNMDDFELATRVKAQVDYVLDLGIPGMREVRQAAAEGKLTKDMLEIVPVANRPMVNAEMFSYAEGTSIISKLLDSSISGYYNLANQLPSTHLLRHPLFGQQYKASLLEQMTKMRQQGITHIDESLRKQMESTARATALRDVKQFTFTMDHETKMAYAMKHFGAFFGAQQESWNRWARIIAEKPQVLGRIAQVYGAPARAGMVVDTDGNTVDATGHVTDPVTGERKLTKYSERKILMQVPEYLGGKELNKLMGLDEKASFVVPMSSVELVLNHGDGALPVGAGPFVQIGVNHFAKDNPDLADMTKKMGLLPFGPRDSWFDFVNPNTGKRLGDSMDDYSETKQRTLFYAMQVENWKWENGQRDTEPTWNELMDRADRWSFWKTGLAFAMPFSLNSQDPYQFFRDEFNRLQKLDPNSADEKFYEKYGDSFYMFSQSMGKNNTGLKPTTEAVHMSQYYQDLVDKVGNEYAGLIVGDEGDGEFSQGAYYYQKTHTLASGDTANQRVQLDAREAWEKGEKARGWQTYNRLINKIDAQLFDRGFKSYEDPGAENLKLQRQAVTKMLTSRTFADGTENAFYNEAWEKEFNSLDKGKYDRTAATLQKIVDDPELQAKMQLPNGTVGQRSDLYTLKTYLFYRTQMQKALMTRKIQGGSDDIKTKSNADLKGSWDKIVMSLLEADTKFAWVHNRWFPSDMGFNMDTIISPEEQETFMSQENTLTGKQMGAGNIGTV